MAGFARRLTTWLACVLPLVAGVLTLVGTATTALAASASVASTDEWAPIALARDEGLEVEQASARAVGDRTSQRGYDDFANLARASGRLGGYRLAPNTTRSFGNYGGEFLDDAIRSPVVRPDLGNLSSKIQRQMGTRGWTPDLIDEAVQQGRAFPAVNKLGGANTPATRYVHPGTGQSVVIDNATGQVIQVGGPGFRY